MCERCRTADDFLINHPPRKGAHPEWELRRERALGWRALMTGDCGSPDVRRGLKAVEALAKLNRQRVAEAKSKVIRARLRRQGK